MNGKNLSPEHLIRGMGYTLVYDSSCGPCAAFRAFIGFLDPRKQLRFVPLGEAERAGMLSSVRADLRWRSFHLVSSEGAAASGAQALPLLARFLPGGGAISKAMLACQPLNGAVAFGYSALSRMHDQGKCAVSVLHRFVDS